MRRFLGFLWQNIGVVAIAAIALFSAIAFTRDASLLVLTGSWTVIATIGVIVYVYLLGVSIGRLDDPDISRRRKTNPVRVLAYAHVRNNVLWVVALLMCDAIGILEFIRYAYVPNLDIPSGLSIAVIYWFLCTGVAIGLLNKRDDDYVETDEQVRDNKT